MAGSSMGLGTRTGENPLAKLVAAAADMSSVGSGFTTTATAPMAKNAN